MIKKIIALVIIISFFSPFISGCATMFHGSKETIHVRSEESDTIFL